VFFLPFSKGFLERDPEIHGIQNFSKKEEHGGFIKEVLEYNYMK